MTFALLPGQGGAMVASLHQVAFGQPVGYVPLRNGYTAEYFIKGEGDPLVLVPGLAGGVGLLGPLVEELAADHTVITFELRGEKSCFCDRTFHFDRFVADLGDVLDGLRLERPGLVGLSFGGAIALDFATRFPNRLEYLAIQGAGARYQQGIFDGVAQRVLDRLLLPDNNPFVNQFFRLLTGGRGLNPSALDFIVDQCWTTDQSVMAHRFALLAEYNVDERLERLQLPVLVLHGEHDILVTPTEMRGFDLHTPHADVRTISDVGHFMFVTHPQRLAAELRDFHRGALATL